MDSKNMHTFGIEWRILLTYIIRYDIMSVCFNA